MNKSGDSFGKNKAHAKKAIGLFFFNEDESNQSRGSPLVDLGSKAICQSIKKDEAMLTTGHKPHAFVGVFSTKKIQPLPFE